LSIDLAHARTFVSVMLLSRIVQVDVISMVLSRSACTRVGFAPTNINFSSILKVMLMSRRSEASIAVMRENRSQAVNFIKLAISHRVCFKS